MRINWHAVEKIDKAHSFNDMAVLFSVRTAVVVSHKIWYVLFSLMFTSKYFIASLVIGPALRLFKRVLLDLKILFRFVTDFYFYYVLVWEYDLYNSSCLTVVLWSSIWSFLANVPNVLEKNVYYSVTVCIYVFYKCQFCELG